MSKLALILDRLAGVLANEPVLTVTLIDAVFAVAVAVGLPVNMQLKAALIGLVAVLGQLYARSVVSPVASLPAAPETPAAPAA